MADASERFKGRENKALSEAERAAALPRRAPTDADAVPAWREPMTKAQRIALDLSKNESALTPATPRDVQQAVTKG